MNQNYNKKLIGNARTLRNNMTKEERHLWYDFLKSLPTTVNRQKTIEKYIVDFYIASAKIVIELDGSQYFSTDGLLKDRIRTEKIEKRNLSVVRIPNNDIHLHFDEVCAYIDRLVNEALA